MNKDDSTYHLSIEMPVPIVEILFQSESSIELLNLENNQAEIIANEIGAETVKAFFEIISYTFLKNCLVRTRRTSVHFQ